MSCYGVAVNELQDVDAVLVYFIGRSSKSYFVLRSFDILQKFAHTVLIYYAHAGI